MSRFAAIAYILSVYVRHQLKATSFKVEVDDYVDEEGIHSISSSISNSDIEEAAPRDLSPDPSPWPNGSVYYEIMTEGFTRRDQELILSLMDAFEHFSCVQFVPRVNQATFIHIKRRTDHKPCQSFIGYKNTGARELYLKDDCLDRNGILHELMHALGFYHEQNRQDRDNYVTIDYSNIDDRYVKNFKKRNHLEQVLVGIGYDFNSIVHYDKYAFAKNKSLPTIITRHDEEIRINGLSKKDKLKINMLYRCNIKESGSTHQKTSPGSPPENIDVSFEENSILIKWQEPIIPNGHVLGYNIYYTTNRTLPMSSWQNFSVPSSGFQSQAIIHDLQEDTTYHIRIAGYTNLGEGVISQIYQSRTGKKSSPPKVTLQPPDTVITISPGASYMVTCTADGHPDPNLSWYRDGQPVAYRTVLKNATVIAAVLTVESLLKTSIFTCRAINALGTATKEIIIEVKAQVTTSIPALHTAGNTILCPNSWTSDENYPHICYSNMFQAESWESARVSCSRSQQGATLPIFHHKSEYISYSKWFWRHTKEPWHCHHSTWLGIEYNMTIKNFSWVDGSKVTFSMMKYGEQPLKGFTLIHKTSSSNWLLENTNDRNLFICQYRLRNTFHQVPLQYPTHEKCPQRENWFYDSRSDICYYLDWKKLNWPVANQICNTKVGGSLPYFQSNDEYFSFNNLLHVLHVPCFDEIWLGYSGRNGIFRNVNGSLPTYFEWSPYNGYPKSFQTISYVYRGGWGNWENTIEPKSYMFLCQCRSGNCMPENV